MKVSAISALFGLYAFSATASGMPYNMLYSRSEYQPSSEHPLSDWLSELYKGINDFRVHSVLDTPLRLRQQLNDFAQKQASKICRQAGRVTGDDILKEMSSAAFDAVSKDAVVGYGLESTKDVLAAWSVYKKNEKTPWTTLTGSDFIYMGIGVCGKTWVAVVTGPFA